MFIQVWCFASSTLSTHFTHSIPAKHFLHRLDAFCFSISLTRRALLFLRIPMGCFWYLLCQLKFEMKHSLEISWWELFPVCGIIVGTTSLYSTFGQIWSQIIDIFYVGSREQRPAYILQPSTNDYRRNCNHLANMVAGNLPPQLVKGKWEREKELSKLREKPKRIIRTDCSYWVEIMEEEEENIKNQG